MPARSVLNCKIYGHTCINTCQCTNVCVVNVVPQVHGEAGSSLTMLPMNAQGLLLDANINRSPSAYLENPAEERARYQHDVDKVMVRLCGPDVDLPTLCLYTYKPLRSCLRGVLGLGWIWGSQCVSACNNNSNNISPASYPTII